MSGANASIKKLRNLLRTRKDVTADEMDRHIRQLAGTNDRLIAVVGGSMVEDALQHKLEDKMPKASAEKLFGPHGIVSAFSSKIEIAHAFGIIDEKLYRNADYIRDIRNVFAHRIAPTTFNTPEVRAVCKLLEVRITAGALENRSMRARFMDSVFWTCLSIALGRTLPTPS